MLLPRPLIHGSRCDIARVMRWRKQTTSTMGLCQEGKSSPDALWRAAEESEPDFVQLASATRLGPLTGIIPDGAFHIFTAVRVAISETLQVDIDHNHFT